jgi:hypothetical protein
MPLGSACAIGTRVHVERLQSGRLHQRDGLVDPRLRVGQRPGALGRSAGFVQQRVERCRKRFAFEPEHALLRLHAREADLRGKREHVGSQARGEQRVRSTVRHLRPGLPEPAGKRPQHLHIGREEQVGQRHRGSPSLQGELSHSIELGRSRR